MRSWRAIIPFSVVCAVLVCALPRAVASEVPPRELPLGVFAKDEPPPDAVERAARFVAFFASVRRARVEIVDYSVAHWPDGTLGIPEEGGIDQPGIVAGYRVILRVRSRFYEARTNLDGSLVKLDPAARDRFVDSLPLGVRARVARHLSTDVKSLRLVLAERVTWYSPAVGCPTPPLTDCVKYQVAGYRLIFKRPDGLYVELHTDRDAYQIRACRR